MKRHLFITALLLTILMTASAQVTTSGINGKVMADGEEAIGATITARYVPTGAIYRGVTNMEGLYSLTGLKAGGPYELEVSYIGFETKKLTDIELQLGQDAVMDVNLSEDAQVIQEVVVVSSKGRSNMRTDRSGAVTSLNSQDMTKIPTVSRSMNDMMKLTPTGNIGANGFAVGGGNFRQSYVTIDGAAFNNAFGIGSNLPVNGSPISLDALEQISVSTSPFDVRQSGFTGGAISAVTKSGTNEVKGTAYLYTTNAHLRGNKVGSVELAERTAFHNTMYGFTLGGPIVKNKLFLFVNGEFEDNVSAGPTWRARTSDAEQWALSGPIHRPTEQRMNEMRDYLSRTYNYNPGAYQGYTSDAPTYKVLARLDWNINDQHKLNVRFSKSRAKSDNPPSASTPLTASAIYPGNVELGYPTGAGVNSNTALYFKSHRYSKDYNFTSVAAEWNAKWGQVTNTLRATYSYQDEPRSYEGGEFPTVHIVEDGALYAAFGPDPYSAGNLARVKTFVATDEVAFSAGIHKLIAGLQYETNEASNGYMAAGNGMYVFNSWSDFANKAMPYAYYVSFAAGGTGSQFIAKMKQNHFSLYLQDQMNLSDRVRMTAGLRMEVPIYPKLKNNYNQAFSEMTFGGEHYATDQLPKSTPSLSPRIGFNWDITGDQRYVLRGGTGYFVGRMPFVWLVSTVLNSNCGQVSTWSFPNQVPFATTVAEQLKYLPAEQTAGGAPSAPTTPTILDKHLKMNAVWKTSLALDARLPYDWRFTVEGMYSREFNPAVVHNLNAYYDGTSTVTLAPGDTRELHATYDRNVNPYYITNAGNKAYFYSLTFQLQKQFDFGLSLSASYTRAKSKTYGDGIGDRVDTAYGSGRYSVNALNNDELGYASFVSPNRVLLTANYRKEYAKNFATTVGLVYDGQNAGYAGTFLYSRYSYTLSSYAVNPNDKRGSNGPSLMYIPESRQALNAWNFADITEQNGSVYSADQQRDDFWNYIQQDNYLKKHTGEYAERGGAVMPWHHQLDLRLMQDFYMKVGGKRNTIQLGIDIENLPNLLNSKWGLYKQIETIYPLNYNTRTGVFNFPKSGSNVRTSTYGNYAALQSTYRIQFSLRYIFN